MREEAKNDLIRHRVWQILQERIERSLEEKDRMYFKGNCVRRASMFVCVREPCFVCCVYFICLFVLQKE